MKRNATLLTAGLITLAPATSFADARIEFHTASEQGDKLVMQVKDRHTRWDQKGESRGTVLFDAETRTLTILNHEDKSYMQLDQSKVKGMSDQMNTMMKQMEAQLANLPPEQREMLMKRMPGMDKSAKSVYTAEKGAGGTKVNGFSCDNMRLLKNGQPQTEACVASARTLGISTDDYDTLATMFESMRDMASQFSGDQGMMPLRELGGLPVRSKDLDSGETTEIVAVSDDRLDGALFEVPAGYKAQQMPSF